MAGSIWINESYVATWITATTGVRSSLKVKTGATDESMVEAPLIRVSPLFRTASRSKPMAKASPLASTSDTDI